MNVRHTRLIIALIGAAIACNTLAFATAENEWEQQQVDLRGPGGRKINAIRYPAGRKKADTPVQVKQQQAQGELSVQSHATEVFSMSMVASPPIAGFVPWVAIGITNARSDEFDYNAYPQPSVSGSFLTGNPQANFAIGIFDTGASSHLIGFEQAIKTGIYSSAMVTDSLVTMLGASGSVDAWASYPLGIFVDGLGAVEPNALLIDTSAMVGQTNVSVVVGDAPYAGAPDVPTVIGTPLSAYYTTVIDNGRRVSVSRDGEVYSGPWVRMYQHGHAAVPVYSSYLPLELRPSGAQQVSYFPNMDAMMNLEFYPGTPSIILGTGSQSLFFVSAVDLGHGTKTATDRRAFMFDTGAQVSVIGSAVASRLELNPANADFEVDIMDVTGAVTVCPGFFIDSLEIPAMGEWLTATNVPVILLDVTSPEGGHLDGIIGMNLFTEFNLVLRGGGFFGQAPPRLYFEPVALRADIAPPGGDGKVDMLDIAAVAAAWLSSPGEPSWNPAADIAPPGGDGIIDFLDFSAVAEHFGWGI